MAEDTQSNLEHQLRSMILSNVTIAQTTAESEAAYTRGRGHGQHRGDGRGRRRGRGSFGQGYDQSRSSHERRNETSSSSRDVDRGRGRPLHHVDGQALSQRGRLVVTDHPSQRGARHNGTSWRRQQDHQDSGPSDSRGTDPMYEPTLLARPQTTNRANLGRGSSSITLQGSSVPIHMQVDMYREHERQSLHLETLAQIEVPKAEMSLAELEQKEMFRLHLQSICQEAIAGDARNDIAEIHLLGFGSLASGFATPGSDMDLAVVPRWSASKTGEDPHLGQEVPRYLEKAILDVSMGARLLTRTRVPILKVCQRPSEALYAALLEERRKWEALPEDEKYEQPGARTSQIRPVDKGAKDETVQHDTRSHDEFPSLSDALKQPRNKAHRPVQPESEAVEESPRTAAPNVTSSEPASNRISVEPNMRQRRTEKPWLREKVLGPLDFPKTGAGFQCDLNFANPLGLHNTHLLRCYSLCDPRVRPFVLFVKAWAKQRKVNSSYSGTLSSYGWVLMVLHYLTNITQPPVCPNLQLVGRWSGLPMNGLASDRATQETIVSGYAVRFWHDEDEIVRAARSGQLTQNRQPLGALLREFFHYYASIPGPGHEARPFHWMNEVISLRTPGGIRTKVEKCWTGARTIQTHGTEVRNRYLFCIEDPFELDHNVARTVTHYGIVAIRDEFRRASRILKAIGRGDEPEGGFFDEVVDAVLAPSLTQDAAETKIEQKPDLSMEHGNAASRNAEVPNLSTQQL